MRQPTEESQANSETMKENAAAKRCGEEKQEGIKLHEQTGGVTAKNNYPNKNASKRYYRQEQDYQSNGQRAATKTERTKRGITADRIGKTQQWEQENLHGSRRSRSKTTKKETTHKESATTGYRRRGQPAKDAANRDEAKKSDRNSDGSARGIGVRKRRRRRSRRRREGKGGGGTRRTRKDIAEENCNKQ